jgi:hypothetical protein
LSLVSDPHMFRSEEGRCAGVPGVTVSAGFAAGVRGRAAALLGPFMDRVRERPALLVCFPGKLADAGGPADLYPARSKLVAVGTNRWSVRKQRNGRLGHLRLQCRACEDEGRRTVYYEPLHDTSQPPTSGMRDAGRLANGFRAVLARRRHGPSVGQARRADVVGALHPGAQRALAAEVGVQRARRVQDDRRAPDDHLREQHRPGRDRGAAEASRTARARLTGYRGARGDFGGQRRFAAQRLIGRSGDGRVTSAIRSAGSFRNARATRRTRSARPAVTAAPRRPARRPCYRPVVQPAHQMTSSLGGLPH